MARVENKFDMKKISMYPVFKLANSVVLNCRAEATIYPEIWLPDYTEASAALRQLLDNKQLSLEAAAGIILDYFVGACDPAKVEVKIETPANNAFCAVSVYAETADKRVTENKPDKPEEKQAKKKEKEAALKELPPLE